MQLGRLCSDIESTRRHSLFKSKGDYFGGQTLYHDTGGYRRWFFPEDTVAISFRE